MRLIPGQPASRTRYRLGPVRVNSGCVSVSTPLAELGVYPAAMRTVITVLAGQVAAAAGVDDRSVPPWVGRAGRGVPAALFVLGAHRTMTIASVEALDSERASAAGISGIG